mgnify:CR=1 FL=1
MAELGGTQGSVDTLEEKRDDKRKEESVNEENPKRQKVTQEKIESREKKDQNSESANENMSDVNEETIEVADSIASSLINILVEQFKRKEGRKPDDSEMEALFSELTEERISELMSTL